MDRAETRREQFDGLGQRRLPAGAPTDAEAAGLFDERFFRYTEDVDSATLIRMLTQGILHAGAEITPLRGRSGGAAGRAEPPVYGAAMSPLYQKHYPASGPAVLPPPGREL